MSATIIKSAQTAKKKLMDLLEVKEMDLTSLDQMLTREETRQQHEARKRIIEEKIMRLELYIGALETSNTKWIEHIEKATQSKKRKEEETYAKMVDDEKSIERILRQLEAMGENLKQSSIEIIIEPKLPAWILDKIYQQKEGQQIWSITKLKQFLAKLIQRSEEIKWSQTLDNTKEQRVTKSKANSRYSLEEASALTITTSPTLNYESKKNAKETNKTKGPCTFCNKDHWNDECPTYPNFKQRIQRLKELKAYSNCLKSGHVSTNCKGRKRLCFHCKNLHNTALCQNKHKVQEQFSETIVLIHLVTISYSINTYYL
uniref:Zinc knuckle family protein n=1 Tax=Wuchereria bancrofti TaxID=6293 RepID=A0AAF5RU17_WUCBA